MQNIRRAVVSIGFGVMVLCSAIAKGGPSSYPSGGDCASALEGAHAPRLELWIDELLASYRADETVLATPPSFQHHSWWARTRNDLLLWRISREFGQADSTTTLERAARAILFDGIVDSGNTDAAESTVASLARGLDEMKRFQREFRDDIGRLRARYGDEFFGPSVIAKSLVNTTLAKILAILSGRSDPRSRDAINALALLHPITDDALDQGWISKNTLGKLSRWLENGEWPERETPYERVVFDLLGLIDRDFPSDEHPLLHQLLARLHRAQLRSLGQKGQMDEDKLLRLSFEKGGLSVAINAYLALDGLSPEQIEFFFKVGAIYQIWDDLSDISNDLVEGAQTVWTAAIRAGLPLGPVARRFLALQADFERSLPAIGPSFDPRRRLTRLYLTGFKFTTLRAFERNQRYFLRDELRSLKSCFPISFVAIRRGFARAGRDERIPEELREALKALDSY